MPHCPRCGNEMPEDAEFCPVCGRSAAAPQSPTLAKVVARRTHGPLPIKEYLQTGWELFKRYPVGFIAFTLIYFLIQLVLRFIPLAGAVAAFVVGPALFMGNFIVSAKLLQDRTPQFSDFFLGFQFFVPLLLTAFVGGLLTGLGLLLVILPGLYAAVAFLFAAPLVVDRRLDFWPALETSRRTVNSIFFGMFGFFLLLILINAAGALCLGVGLLASAPVTFCAVTAAYADVFGLQSDYSEGFPDNAAPPPAPSGE